MYHLPHVCHTLVPKIRVHPEMLHVFRYIDVFTCVVYNEQYDDWSYSLLAVKIINDDR